MAEEDQLNLFNRGIQYSGIDYLIRPTPLMKKLEEYMKSVTRDQLVSIKKDHPLDWLLVIIERAGITLSDADRASYYRRYHPNEDTMEIINDLKHENMISK